MKKFIEKIKSFLLIKLEPHRLKRTFHYFLEEYKFLFDIRYTKPLMQQKIVFGRNSIAFLIPKFNAFAGGVTSVLRLGTYLTELGHDVNYIIVDEDSLQRANDNAKTCLPYFKGSIRLFEQNIDNYDIGIATYWSTAYLVHLKQNHFKIKAYFIQDFEPGFYPAGEQYYLALNTYKINLFMISLGGWCKEQIESKLENVSVAHVPFPYEQKQYDSPPREISFDNVLKVAVYLKNIPSRAPVVILTGLKILEKLLLEKGKVLDALIFGMDPTFDLGVGKNLGKIDSQRMRQIYETSHIGIASSLTNVSLVPYEMMGCGLPVVDFKDGSASYFFPDSSIELSNTNPFDFATTVLNLANNQNRLNEIARNAREFIKGQTWEKTAYLFNEQLRLFNEKLKENYH